MDLGLEIDGSESGFLDGIGQRTHPFLQSELLGRGIRTRIEEFFCRQRCWTLFLDGPVENNQRQYDTRYTPMNSAAVRSGQIRRKGRHWLV